MAKNVERSSQDYEETLALVKQHNKEMKQIEEGLADAIQQMKEEPDAPMPKISTLYLAKVATATVCLRLVAQFRPETQFAMDVHGCGLEGSMKLADRVKELVTLDKELSVDVEKLRDEVAEKNPDLL